MTTTLPNDGLLKAARILTAIFMVLTAIGAVALIVAIPVVLLGQSHIADAMLPTADSALGGVLGALMIVLLCGSAIMALAFAFLRLLRQLIGTVGEGDPFIFENAVRLRTMGWIAVIVELTKIPAGAMAIFLAGQFETDHMQLDIDFSLTGILLALVLFILARVFRHGATMREDLEGTV